MVTLYALPTALRAELKPPMAPVLTTAQAVAEVQDHFLIAVGDVCAEHFLEEGVVPDVLVADWATQRGAVAARGTHGEGLDALRALHARIERGETGRLHRVTNPAATITRALWDALEDAVRGAGPTLIEVTGEEDLAVLPALVLAPDGACVAYGQPDEGVVVVPVNASSRERARDLLARMRTDSHSPESSQEV